MTSKACIIGAGASGLAAAKTLRESDIPFDWFEMGSGIGGNWRYDNDNGRSAAYDSLHIDTSKDRMAYSDLPMPGEFPNYLHHSQVLEYFESYVERFALAPLLTLRTRVEQVEPIAGGGYEVTTASLDSGERATGTYSTVLVCNGHHWCPKMPDFPGVLDGETLHSRDYRRPDNLDGKRVLILGVGNSGVDITCDVAPVAARTLLASRRGAHVIPRHLLGRPTDKWTTLLSSKLPLGLQRLFYRIIVWLSRGRQSSYGMPAPSTRILTEHPTLSTELLPLVKQGKVTPKPAIERLDGQDVVFVDGSREPVDVLICATGYRISFPFLDDDVVSTDDNRIGLYGKVVHPDHAGLFFIGLIQPLGAIMPLAELQARWVAGLLAGELSLPGREEMKASIDRDHAALTERYVPSTRHTIQVDFFPYKRWVEARLRRTVA